MKRSVAVFAAALLAVACCACSTNTNANNVIPTNVAPLTTAPAATVEPSAANGSAAPETSADPAASSDPAASAEASASPTPASTTASPKVTSAAGTTDTATATDVDVLSGWKSMVSNSSYIVVGKVTKDIGVVDTLDGTKTREIAPNAYIGDWQYEFEVSQVLKTADTGKITRNTTIVASFPYERCMNTKSRPMEKDDAFVALTEGNSYVLFLDYDEELKFYTPAGFEPNKFSLSGSTLYILTGKEGLDIAWEAGAGKTGVTLSSLENACK